VLEDECGEEEKALNLVKFIGGDQTDENWWCEFQVGGLSLLFNSVGLLF